MFRYLILVFEENRCIGGGEGMVGTGCGRLSCNVLIFNGSWALIFSRMVNSPLAHSWLRS